VKSRNIYTKINMKHACHVPTNKVDLIYTPFRQTIIYMKQARSKNHEFQILKLNFPRGRYYWLFIKEKRDSRCPITLLLRCNSPESSAWITSEELSEWWFFTSGACCTVLFEKSSMLLPGLVLVMHDLGEDAESIWLTWGLLLLVPDVWISSPPPPPPWPWPWP
jgi:hypothetical protein